MRVRHIHNIEGSAILETAVMLPLLLVTLLFIVNFGYLVIVATNLVTASRNARCIPFKDSIHRLNSYYRKLAPPDRWLTRRASPE